MSRVFWAETGTGELLGSGETGEGGARRVAGTDGDRLGLEWVLAPLVSLDAFTTPPEKKRKEKGETRRVLAHATKPEYHTSPLPPYRSQ